MASLFKKFADFVGDNSVEGDAAAEEKKLREAFPFLLAEGETVAFAFTGRGGSGRDTEYITDRRILIRDVKGITGTSVKYTSYPLSQIKAYAVSTAGGGLDGDSELQVWCSGMPALEIEFAKDNVDLFALNSFLNKKVLPSNDNAAGESAAPFSRGPKTDPGALSSFLNWLGDDAHEVDPLELEQRLKTSPHVLEHDEKVELAYKSGRDHMILSSKRLLLLDKRGFTGKKCVYLSVLWKCVRAFSVETAGTWDRDYELKLYTNIDSHYTCILQDLRSGSTNILAVQRFFSDKILGDDTAPAVGNFDAQRLQGQADSGSGFLAWCGDDCRQLDAAQAEEQFRTSTPVLQGSETVEFAFKGRRDMVLFTSKRLLSVDVKGWTGKKKQFTSVPWSTIKAFGVRSAGSFMDKDSEMYVWTDIMHDWVQTDDGPKPVPGMSFLEFDFQKDKVDLMSIQRYLALRCIPLQGLPADVPVPTSVLEGAKQGGTVETMLNWLGEDHVQLNAGDVQAKLDEANLTIPGEKVSMAFKAGRDSLILTNRRYLYIDVQGFSGKRISYTSIPYTSMRAFSVESAGSFDRDSELKIYTKCRWVLSEVDHDLKKNRVDILAIQAYLASMIFGLYDGTTAVAQPQSSGFPQGVGGIEGFLSWLGDDAHQIDAAAVQQRFREDTPLLQPDETVVAAFKVLRDMWLITSKRLLFVDVKGWSGKKVNYMSVPLQFCTSMQMKTAGKFDRDSEIRIFTDVPALGRLSMDLRKGKANTEQIWRVLQVKFLS